MTDESKNLPITEELIKFAIELESIFMPQIKRQQDQQLGIKKGEPIGSPILIKLEEKSVGELSVDPRSSSSHTSSSCPALNGPTPAEEEMVNQIYGYSSQQTNV